MVNSTKYFLAPFLFIFSAILLAACGGSGGSSSTATALSSASKIDPDEACRDLIAGQHIQVGSVCLDTDEFFLYVTYSTDHPWVLEEVHLFVGQSFDEMPRNPAGHPIIGQFPYIAGGDSDTPLDSNTEHTFAILLGDLDAECDDLLAIAAHAVVRNTQTGDEETAWGDGDPINPRAGWAMWSEYRINCDDDEDVPVGTCGKETAYAVGDTQFDELGFGNWGWQLTLDNGSSGEADLYAAAGQHDLNKGTHVGTVEYEYIEPSLMLTYSTFEGFALLKAHVYANDEPLSSPAPGLFGNQQSAEDGTDTMVFNIEVSGDPIYVAAHAEVVSTDCDEEEDD